jgi:hypothetical protein
LNFYAHIMEGMQTMGAEKKAREHRQGGAAKSDGGMGQLRFWHD